MRISGKWLNTALFAAFAFAGLAQAEVIGTAGSASWDALPLEEKTRITTSVQSFFLHQSVGGDLEDGANAAGYKFEYAASGTTRLSSGLNGGLFASSNGDPTGKISEFRNMALANKATLHVAIMKFGYADIVEGTLATAQNDYLAAVNAIKAEGMRVLHITPPFVYNVPSENLPKMQMRAWMIDTFSGDTIFDLEDNESTDPVTGARCEREGAWEICNSIRSTSACPSLNQGVDAPSGQGHLCFDPHAKRIARSFLYAIYRAGNPAGSVPGAPRIDSITPGSGSARISFTPPASAGSSAISSYTATCATAGRPSRTASTSASPATVTGLPGGISHACTLTAANSFGSSPASNSVQVTPLPPKKAPATFLLFTD